MKKSLKANIWKFNLFQVLNGIFFAIPVIVLFWQENGLTFTEIMILQSIFSLAVVLLEIPTGYIADVYGRKKAIVFASIGMLLGMSAYSLGHNFAQFLIAEVFWAIGISLLSGSDSAFLYDTLVDLKKEKLYKKIWGNAQFYYLVSLGISNIIGGFVGSINLRFTFYLALPFLAALIPIALSFQEPQRHKLVIKKGYLNTLLKTLLYSIWKNKKLRWLILFAGITFAFTNTALWFYQPYFKLSGLEIVHFGFVFASFQIVAAFTSKYSYKVEEKLGQKYSLVLIIVILGISYFLMSHFVYIFSFVFAYIHQFVRGFKKVVISDYINALTSSDIRATVISAESMIGKLIYAIIIPFAGYIADVYSFIQALTVVGVTTIIAGGIILFVLYKEKVI